MRSTTLILTPRLRVRTWRTADLPALHALLADPEVEHLSGIRSWTIQESRGLIEQTPYRSGAQLGYFNGALIRRQDGHLLGCVSLTPYDLEARVPKIEWTLCPEAWESGLALEIGRGMLSYAFSHVRFPAVVGHAPREHAAAHTLLQKLGFQHVGDFEYKPLESHATSNCVSSYRKENLQ